MFRRHTEARRPALTIRIDGVATEAREGDIVDECVRLAFVQFGRR